MTTTPTAPPPALRPYLTDRHTALWQEADAFTAEHVAPRADRMEAAPLSSSRSCKRAAGLRARHDCCPLSKSMTWG
ncbi:hypothetical protein ABZY14_33075, partial [Streptomyces sp. NPDC006617]